MLCVIIVSLLAGVAAANQAFATSGEINITSCPITYYGQKYEKAYVTFSANRFAVCFNGLYHPGVKNDCIILSKGAADRGHLAVLDKEIPTGSGIHRLLPNLRNAGKCVNILPLKDSLETTIEQVELGNFGSQAILAIRTFSGYTSVEVEADALVNGLALSTHTFQRAQTAMGVVTDVSGCRLSGIAYKTNTTVKEPQTCSTVHCDVRGVATKVSDCGRMERCRSGGSCVLNAVCTVTGPTVIDFTGRVHAIPDRCGYSLLSVPGLQVLGIFLERRRRDVSFLDHIVLLLDRDIKVSLEQGSKVQVNDQELVLGTAAHVVHGVELSKDHTGVTAKISTSKLALSIFFDGSTALIHMTGQDGTSVEGLCGDSNRTLRESWVSKHSSSECQVKYDDAADNTIDCDAAAKWCHFLQQTPFTTCHSHVDPQPFIAACRSTLCQYPAVDGLPCQFLQAYTAGCERVSGINMEDWRSKTRCAAVPQASSQERFCSDHEFSGEDTNSRESRCVCRAIFASKYKPENSFGEPTVCEEKAASITLANCLLEDKGIDFSVLHLNDQTCKGKMDNLTHMVTFSFNSNNTCGTIVMANNSQIIYKNTIRSQDISMFGLITRHDGVHVDVSCHYNQPEVRSLAIKLKHSSVTQQIRSGEWTYSLNMKAYTDPDRTKALESSIDIQLNTKLWVELKTDGLDGEMVAVVTNSCWATDQPLPSGSLRYDLIINGCPNPVDQTVTVVGNGQETSNYFSFNTFQFSGKTSQVYLHCRVELCIRQGDNCIPKCSHGRRERRSAMWRSEDQNPALITMAWTF